MTRALLLPWTLALLAAWAPHVLAQGEPPKLKVEIQGSATVRSGELATVKLSFTLGGVLFPHTARLQLRSSNRASSFEGLIVELKDESEKTITGVFTQAGDQSVRADVIEGLVTGPTHRSVTFTVTVGLPAALEIDTAETIAAGSPTTVALRSVDAYGQATTDAAGPASIRFAGMDVLLSLSGGTGSATFTPTLAGLYTIQATMLDDTAIAGYRVAFVRAGVVSSLTVESGADQRGAIDRPLREPFVVRAFDAFGNAVAGTSMVFRVASGSLGFAGAGETSVPTDSRGVAEAVGTGTALGAFVVRVESAEAPAVFVEIAGEIARLVDRFVITGLAGSAVAGTAHSATIVAETSTGEPVVDFAETLLLDIGGAGVPPNGAVPGATSVAAIFSSGEATVAFTLYRAGTASLSISYPTTGAATTRTMVIVPGAAVGLAPESYTAQATMGKSVPMSGIVADLYGNAVPGAGVPVSLEIEVIAALGDEGAFEAGPSLFEPATPGRLVASFGGYSYITGGPATTSAIYDGSRHILLPSPGPLVSRTGATLTALSDGRALLFGGHAPGEPPGELATPFTGITVPVVGLAPPRRDHQATVLPDGKVLITGGVSKDVVLGVPVDVVTASTLLFTPETGELVAGPAMPMPRTSHVALAFGGKVYVLGGKDTAGPTSVVCVFDPATATWATHGSLLAPRSGAQVVEISAGVLLVVGGTGADGTPLGTTELYTLATAVAESAGDLAEPFPGARLVRYDEDRAIWLGGVSADGEASPQSSLFARGSGWRPGPQMLHRDAAPVAFAETLDAGEVVVLPSDGADAQVEFYRAPLSRRGVFDNGLATHLGSTDSDGRFRFALLPGAGPQVVVATAPALTEARFPIEGLVVPGEVAKLAWSSVPATIPAGAHFAPVLTAVDAEGATVPYDGLVAVTVTHADPPFATELVLALEDGAVAVPFVGFAVSGSQVLVARLLDNPSIQGRSAAIAVVAADPAAIAHVAGAGSTVLPGSALPDVPGIVFEVRDRFANPVIGIPVELVASAGAFEGGAPSATFVTGPDGRVRAVGYVAPLDPGLVTMVASVGPIASAPMSITVPSPVPPDTLSAVHPRARMGALGAEVELIVEATSLGRPIVGVPIHFTVSAGSGTIGPAHVLTDATGRASVRVVAATEGRTAVLATTEDGTALSTSVEALHVVAGGVASVELAMAAFSQAGQSQTLTVTLRDEMGELVSGVELVSVVIGGTSYALEVTDGFGELEFTPTTAGSFTASVSLVGGGALDGEVGTIAGETTAANPQAIELAPPSIATQPSAVLAEGASTARVTDAHGNVVKQAEVSFHVETFDSTFGGQTSFDAVTDGSGHVTLPAVSVGEIEGEHEISARSGAARGTLLLDVRFKVAELVATMYGRRTLTREIVLAPAVPGETLVAPPRHVVMIRPRPDLPPAPTVVIDDTLPVPSLVMTVLQEGATEGVFLPLPGVVVEYEILDAADTLSSDARAGLDMSRLVTHAVLVGQPVLVQEGLSFDVWPVTDSVHPLGHKARSVTNAEGHAGVDLSLRIPGDIDPGETDAGRPFVAIAVTVHSAFARVDSAVVPPSQRYVLVLPIDHPRLDLVTPAGFTALELIAGSPTQITGEGETLAVSGVTPSSFPRVEVYRPRPLGAMGEGTPILLPNQRVYLGVYLGSVRRDGAFFVEWNDLVTTATPGLDSQRMVVIPRSGAGESSYKVVASLSSAVPPFDTLRSVSYTLKVEKDFPEITAEELLFTRTFRGRRASTAAPCSAATCPMDATPTPPSSGCQPPSSSSFRVRWRLRPTTSGPAPRIRGAPSTRGSSTSRRTPRISQTRPRRPRRRPGSRRCRPRCPIPSASASSTRPGPSATSCTRAAR